MRCFVFATAFLALALAVSASPAVEEIDGFPVVYGFKQGDKCPASKFYDDCNFCGCGKDGYSAACTRMACPHPVKERSLKNMDLPVVYGYEQGEKCPAKAFYDDCNYCFCGANGHSAGCTKMACPHFHMKPRNSANRVVVHGYKQGEQCPAKHFYDDCNACTCGADGKSAACTLMFCIKSRKAIPDYPHIDNFDELQKCTPNQSFYIQCNTCHCGSDGKTAACTYMFCGEN